MSFVKIPRRTARSSAPAPKRKPKKKPAWDDSNNDLTVHAATPEEVVRRKVVHESKNMDLVKAEKLHQKISKATKQNRTHGRKKQMPLLREVLYDQNQLQDVLAKSDRAMAVVRDLFGDDPKRYRGLPNVTVAPNQVYLDGSLPTGTTIDGPSKLDMLSDSVMDKTALNEYDAHGTDTEDEDEGTLQFKPLLDFGRFRKFLEDEQERAKQDDNLQKAQDAQDVAKRMEAEMHELGIKSPEEVDAGHQVTSPHDGSFIEEKTPATTPRVKAMNDTGKVNRVRSRLGHNEQEQSTVDNNNTNNSTLSGTLNMDDLRKVLDGLEGNLAAYERQTGRAHTNRSAPPETFSGYTMSLVNAVNKLTVYLKESELRLRAETMVREQLTEDVDQLKTLIDTLTSDLIGMQEDYTTQQDEFYKYRLLTQQELHNIKTALVSQGVPVLFSQQNGDVAKATNLHTSQPSSKVPQDNSMQAHANANPASTVPASRQPVPQPPQAQQAPQAGTNMPPTQPTQQPQNLHQLQQSQDQLQQQYQHNQQLLQQYQKQQQQLQQQQQNQQQKQQQQQQQQQHQQHQQQQQQRPPSQVEGNLLTHVSGQHDISNLTTQQLQTLLLQQMMMSQRQASDLVSQHNQTTDSSLEQHPLSSSMTSQSTLQSASSGRPMPNLPVTSHPPSVLPAMLLTPPRQTNSPQAQNKTQAHANSLAAAMETFKQEGRLDALKNVIYKQQVAVQNGDMQSPDQNRVQRPGQFRPIPMDSDHQDTLYFSQHQQFQHDKNSQRSLQGQQMISQGQDRAGQGQHMPGQGQQFQGQGTSSQQGNTSVMSSHSTGPAERIEVNRELLARQIEELNRQHAEAEGKLGRLLHNQYSAVQALTEVAPASHISPSISPIPAGSESAVTVMSDMSSSVSFAREQLTQRPGGGATGATHGITVSLPRMDMLNWSDTSTPTLSTSKTVSRRDSNSPVPIMTISPSEGEQTPFKDNQKVNPQSTFFALTTHVS